MDKYRLYSAQTCYNCSNHTGATIILKEYKYNTFWIWAVCENHYNLYAEKGKVNRTNIISKEEYNLLKILEK